MGMVVVVVGRMVVVVVERMVEVVQVLGQPS